MTSQTENPPPPKTTPPRNLKPDKDKLLQFFYFIKPCEVHQKKGGRNGGALTCASNPNECKTLKQLECDKLRSSDNQAEEEKKSESGSESSVSSEESDSSLGDEDDDELSMTQSIKSTLLREEVGSCTETDKSDESVAKN